MLSSFEQVFVVGFEGAYASADVFFSIYIFFSGFYFYLYAALVWQFFVGLSCVFIFFGLFAYFMRGNLFLFHFSNQLNLITSFVFFFIRPLMAFQQMC